MRNKHEYDHTRILSSQKDNANLDLTDRADPAVILLPNGTQVMYTTQKFNPNNPSENYHIGMSFSQNGTHWTKPVEALAKKNIENANTWAPFVTQRKDGIWIMHYSAQVSKGAEPFRMALFVSESSSPFGPFVNETLVLDNKIPGFATIDSSLFVDPQARNDMDATYLLFGSSDKGIHSARLLPDLKTLNPQTLRPLIAAQPGDKDLYLIEAPTMVYLPHARKSERYRLQVSGSDCWHEGTYWVHEYHGPSVDGPFILRTRRVIPENAGRTSAGHHSLVYQPNGIPVFDHTHTGIEIPVGFHYILPGDTKKEPPQDPLERPYYSGVLAMDDGDTRLIEEKSGPAMRRVPTR